ncbi:MAG: HAD-IA family hydrolase [Deltaproteobacteria bacterium]|nr:HAD-IA family hydrolase [Deltaproteobacteria bacterium]
MNNIKVVTFDCDGVLFDTKDVNRMYYNKVLEYMGMPPLTGEQTDFAHIQTASAVLRFFFKDDKSYNKAEAFRTSMDYTPFVEYMKIEPYLKTLLNKLKPKYKLAIATNRTNTMPTALKEFGLEQYFDYVVCALDVKNPKPDPEQLYKIIDFFKVKPKQIIYIGDAVTDEKASYAAGVPFVAYDNKKLKADFYINGLEEVEKILKI